MKALRLRRNEERRLRAGHLWVFSNEVDVQQTPLTGFEPGEPVEIQDSRGAPVGSGYVNPRSLICARLVSRRPGTPLDRALLRRRVLGALDLRDRLYPGKPFYRLIFGEGDGLPGLVVDRFGASLVVQITTAGIDSLTDEVLDVLEETLHPEGILLRNDTSSREMEGLPSFTSVARGVVPEKIEIEENNVRFMMPLLGGQKTGWFYDHRDNRQRLRRYVDSARVLDLFSYVGAWGIPAAVSGASEVVCVDSSAGALEYVTENARLNSVGGRVRTIHGDAFEALQNFQETRSRFDVIVIDPPAFIKKKKDLPQGAKAYQKINRGALDLLQPGGIIVSASCSFHISRDDFLSVILRASRDAKRELQIIEEGHQGPDHPIHPAIPETAYLKAIFARILPE